MLCYLVGVAVAYSVEHPVVEYAVDLPVVDLEVAVFLHVEEADVERHLCGGGEPLPAMTDGVTCSCEFAPEVPRSARDEFGPARESVDAPLGYL